MRFQSRLLVKYILHANGNPSVPIYFWWWYEKIDAETGRVILLQLQHLWLTKLTQSLLYRVIHQSPPAALYGSAHFHFCNQKNVLGVGFSKNSAQ